MKYQYKIVAGYRDAVTYGQSFALVGFRKWWNPLRWLLGRVKIKQVSQTEFWKEGN